VKPDGSCMRRSASETPAYLFVFICVQNNCFLNSWQPNHCEYLDRSVKMRHPTQR
jgi:hypothetical protein